MRSRSRGHTDYRHRPARPGDLLMQHAMIVAGEDQFRTGARDDLAERRRVGQTLVQGTVARGRMMDQHDAEGVFSAERFERLRQRIELLTPKLAGGEKRRSRQPGGKTDDRQRSAPAHERIGRLAHGVAEQEIPPREMCARVAAHIDVVVAGNDRDLLGQPELGQEREPDGKFGGQRQVGEVAGHRDMVGYLRLEIGDDLGQHVLAVMHPAFDPPVEIARRPFAEELRQARLRQRRNMRVGKMRKDEHCRLHEFPISTPAANTSAPPKATCRLADQNGESM